MSKEKAMTQDDVAEARMALEMAHEYAKGNVRFFPMIIANDEELQEIANQNLERISQLINPK